MKARARVGDVAPRAIQRDGVGSTRCSCSIPGRFQQVAPKASPSPRPDRQPAWQLFGQMRDQRLRCRIGPSAENTPGRVTMPAPWPIARRPVAGSQPVAARSRGKSCHARGNAPRRPGKGRNSFITASMPSVFLPIDPSAAPGQMRHRLGDAGASGPTATGKEDDCPSKSPAAGGRDVETRAFKRLIVSETVPARSASARSNRSRSVPASAPIKQHFLRAAAPKTSSSRDPANFLLFFHGALQRDAAGGGKLHDLRHLGFSDLVREDADDRHPLAMHGQHDFDGLGMGHVEQTFSETWTTNSIGVKSSFSNRTLYIGGPLVRGRVFTARSFAVLGFIGHLLDRRSLQPGIWGFEAEWGLFPRMISPARNRASSLRHPHLKGKIIQKAGKLTVSVPDEGVLLSVY